MRLVVLGGSGSSTPELFDALAAWPGGIERRPQLDVVLVGRDAEKLHLVEAACRARIGAGPRLTVSSETDRRKALDGTDFVLNQVRIGGYAARSFDESFPWQVGIPGEETMGPGGFANANRTVPALRRSWQDVVEIAPQALVVNLTNPAGIVQAAAQAEFAELHVVSVCDSPMPILDRIAERFDRERTRVWLHYFGMNHLGWYVPEEADTPEMLEKIADLASGHDPLDVRLEQAVGAPYVRYYVHPDRILAQQQGKQTRAQALIDLESKLLAGYRENPSGDLPKRGAQVWYRMAVLAYLDAWINGSSETPILAGVLNGTRIPSLPANVVVELPHHVHGPGDLRPADPAALPLLPAALLAAHATYESLAVTALTTSGDGDARLRALAANPMVPDIDRAVALLKAIDEGPKG